MATVAEVDEIQAPPSDTSRSDRLYRITIDQFEAMAHAGIFGSKSRIILWKGRLIEPMTKGRPHTIALTRLDHLVVRLLPDGWFVEQEAPMAIPDDGLPEPDLKVVRGKLDDFPEKHPSTRDVAWIVEVSDSSLSEDQGEVLQSYAEQSIPVYWIVNIPGRCIQVYTDPTGPSAAPTYRSLTKFQPGQVVPVVLDGREVGGIAVSDVLP